MTSAPPPGMGQGLVTLVVGSFDALVGHGLMSILGGDRRIRILDAGVEAVRVKEVVGALSPAVVILDEANLRLLWSWLSATQPTTGVVVLAREPLHCYGMVLLAAGATCVAQNARAADILAAVHAAASGSCMFVTVVGECVAWSGRGEPGMLTLREHQVLEGLSEKRSDEEIARGLMISPVTVRKHTARLLGKLGAASRRDLGGLPVLGRGAGRGPRGSIGVDAFTLPLAPENSECI
jgi:two-component system nitrate/nitrite response regulator NarL